MDRETRKALKASIAHWYRISACETVPELNREGFTASSCALCQISRIDCTDCIIMGHTHLDECGGTPYFRAAWSLRSWVETGEWYNTDQDNIEAEIRFLESLLEE